jgi:formate/nitrite transporter FocA (FNT family)
MTLGLTVFTLGLILVVVAGSELLTGNMALPLAVLRRAGDFDEAAIATTRGAPVASRS